MPPKSKLPAKAESSKKKKKKKGTPQPPNPKGTRVKVLGANGKIRWEWQ